MPLDSIVVRGARENNHAPLCHSERPQGAKNLGEATSDGETAETLRGVYPERQRRAQGDMGERNRPCP